MFHLSAMKRRNNFKLFFGLTVDCENKLLKKLLRSEATFAKIYFTKISSSVKVLDSLSPSAVYWF